jgi:GNAT superfamily N-acetyltransferase
MPSSLTVKPLAQHPELLPLVAEWFVSEWPSWYGPGGSGNLTEDLSAFAASETTLPVGMVVFEGQVAIGAGALKAQSIPSHSHLSPWAAAGYVLPACRGRGVGAVLLQGLVAQANALGYKYVYCGTSSAESLLTRAGWLPLETTSHDGKPLTIFRSAA